LGPKVSYNKLTIWEKESVWDIKKAKVAKEKLQNWLAAQTWTHGAKVTIEPADRETLRLVVTMSVQPAEIDPTYEGFPLVVRVV
jgi:hypothetical protein